MIIDSGAATCELVNGSDARNKARTRQTVVYIYIKATHMFDIRRMSKQAVLEATSPRWSHRSRPVIDDQLRSNTPAAQLPVPQRIIPRNDGLSITASCLCAPVASACAQGLRPHSAFKQACQGLDMQDQHLAIASVFIPSGGPTSQVEGNNHKVWTLVASCIFSMLCSHW